VARWRQGWDAGQFWPANIEPTDEPANQPEPAPDDVGHDGGSLF
jgi:hypothetical protein